MYLEYLGCWYGCSRETFMCSIATGIGHQIGGVRCEHGYTWSTVLVLVSTCYIRSIIHCIGATNSSITLQQGGLVDCRMRSFKIHACVRSKSPSSRFVIRLRTSRSLH